MTKRICLLTALTACAPAEPPPTQTAIDFSSFAVVATVANDYSVGALSAVDFDSFEVRDQVTATTGDSSVRVTGDWVVQLNRFNYDNLRLYSPRDWRIPQTEFSVGSQANPHDVSFCENKLFVSLYGRDYLGVYDPYTGHEQGQVDLSAFADGDSIGPEPSSLLVIEDTVYVALQRLNRAADWSDAGGKVVAIDCESQSVVESWSVGANIALHSSGISDSLLVSGRAYNDEPGGLWELEHHGSGHPQRLISSEEHSHIDGAAATEHAIVFVEVMNDETYSLRCLDRASGQIETLSDMDSFVTDIRATSSGEAWISTRAHWSTPSGQAGLLVADIDRCEMLTDNPIETALPPYAIDFVEGLP